MKFCSNCGTQLPDEAVFCASCGVKLSDLARPAPAAPAQPVQPVQPTQPVRPVQPVQPVQPNQAVYQQTVYQTVVQQPAQPTRPFNQLKTNRGLAKFIFLSIVTFGIYGLVVMSGVSTDINTIAGRYDGKKTMHYCLVVFLFSWLTCGILTLVWSHKISARIGAELKRRGIVYHFGAGSFWGWNILGSLIYVGPFIYMHRLLKSMNLLSQHYNING